MGILPVGLPEYPNPNSNTNAYPNPNPNPINHTYTIIRIYTTVLQFSMSPGIPFILGHKVKAQNTLLTWFFALLWVLACTIQCNCRKSSQDLSSYQIVTSSFADIIVAVFYDARVRCRVVVWTQYVPCRQGRPNLGGNDASCVMDILGGGKKTFCDLLYCIVNSIMFVS